MMEFQKSYITIFILNFILMTVPSFAFGQITTQALLKGPSGIAAVRTQAPTYYAIKWYRDSAERIAIYREIFLLGEMAIKQKVTAQHLKPHRWGIIIDIDETALDNSAWHYQRDIAGSTIPFTSFAAEKQSHANPGVKKLTRFVHNLGGYVNFVSNRPGTLLKATRLNLRNQGIYFDQILLDPSNQYSSLTDKNVRFNAIMSGRSPSHLPRQKIVAWFGDNIQDFPKLKQSDMIEADPNGSSFDQFGVSYFIVPNPIYGSWESNKFN